MNSLRLKRQSFIHKTRVRILCLLISVIAIIYLFLISPNLSRSKALEPFRSTSFAHRGLFDNASHIPENSLVAFQKAIDSDYGIELDVQLTKDKVPVIFHDSDLKRACGEDLLISSLTFDELSNYPLFDSTETIPSLKEALTLIHGQVPVLIELKVELSYLETCKKVNECLTSYEGPFCMISFNPLALNWFRKKNPAAIRGQLSTNYFKDKIKQPVAIQFLLSNLLLNCFSRPDLILYNNCYEDNFSLNVCKKLFKCPTLFWTITNEERYLEIKAQNDIPIFDSFVPNAELHP